MVSLQLQSGVLVSMVTQQTGSEALALSRINSRKTLPFKYARTSAHTLTNQRPDNEEGLSVLLSVSGAAHAFIDYCLAVAMYCAATTDVFQGDKLHEI